MWQNGVLSGQLRQSLSIVHRFKIVTPAVALIAVASAYIAAPVVIGVFTASADFADGYAVIAYFVLIFATYHVVIFAFAIQQAVQIIIMRFQHTTENIDQPYAYCV